MKLKHKMHRGFTLMELIIVLTILVSTIVGLAWIICQAL